MTTIGVRELRRSASKVLSQVEAGDTVTISVAGILVARIVPIVEDNWVSWESVNLIFSSSTDSEWNAQRRKFGGEEISDPWGVQSLGS